MPFVSSLSNAPFFPSSNGKEKSFAMMMMLLSIRAKTDDAFHQSTFLSPQKKSRNSDAKNAASLETAERASVTRSRRFV
jgi:hypothetical protein